MSYHQADVEIESEAPVPALFEVDLNGDIKPAKLKRLLESHFGSLDDYRAMNRRRRTEGLSGMIDWYMGPVAAFLDNGDVSGSCHLEIYHILRTCLGEFAKFIQLPTIYVWKSFSMSRILL